MQLGPQRDGGPPRQGRPGGGPGAAAAFQRFLQLLALRLPRWWRSVAASTFIVSVWLLFFGDGRPTLRSLAVGRAGDCASEILEWLGNTTELGAGLELSAGSGPARGALRAAGFASVAAVAADSFEPAGIGFLRRRFDVVVVAELPPHARSSPAAAALGVPLSLFDRALFACLPGDALSSPAEIESLRSLRVGFSPLSRPAACCRRGESLWAFRAADLDPCENDGSRRLEVLRVTYGVPGTRQERDVTTTFRNLPEKAKGSLPKDTFWPDYVFGDPAPAEKAEDKILEVRYRVDGGEELRARYRGTVRYVDDASLPYCSVPGRPPHADAYERYPVALAVMTVDRPEQYIHSTLASLFLSGPVAGRAPVHLVVGSRDAAYLDAGYAHNARVSIRAMTAAEEETAAGLDHIRKRATFNYHRCLAVPRPPGAGVLVLEDDVVVREDFLLHLSTIAREIKALHGPRFVLSVYCPWHAPGPFFPVPRSGSSSPPFAYPSVDFGDGSAWVAASRFMPYPREFYGTQAIFFSDAVVDGMAAFMLQKAKVPSAFDRTPYDHLIRHYCNANDIPLFATTESLVQHVGRRSTGLATFAHRSPNWQSRRIPDDGAGGVDLEGGADGGGGS
eukprot:tig00000911_g5402.t1